MSKGQEDSFLFAVPEHMSGQNSWMTWVFANYYIIEITSHDAKKNTLQCPGEKLCMVSGEKKPLRF